MFFKKLIFPEFWPIKSVFQLIEIVIKICYKSLSISIGARLVLDQSKHFQPIESNFRSVKNRIESFLKNEFLTCSYTFSKLFKLFLSLFDLSKVPSKFFCRFPPKFSQDFPSTRPVRLFCPFFFIYFMFSCIKSCFLGKILNLLDFGIFVDSNHISWNWSMGFCYKLLYNWSWWFNLINLVNCKKLKILGFEFIWFGDFVQLVLIWWNWLVELIYLIIIWCYLSCLMIN